MILSYCYYKILTTWSLRNKTSLKFSSGKLRFHLQILYLLQIKMPTEGCDSIDSLHMKLCMQPCVCMTKKLRKHRYNVIYVIHTYYARWFCCFSTKKKSYCNLMQGK